MWIGGLIYTFCFRLGFQIKIELTPPQPAICAIYNAEMMEVGKNTYF